MSREKESKNTNEETFEGRASGETLTGEASREGGDTAGEASGESEASESSVAREQEKEDEQNTKYLRLMADFQNYKRRSEKEKSDIYSFANEKLIGELLKVLDDFERALKHEAGEGSAFSEGMTMIFKNLKETLEKAGLEEVEALGKEFDPNEHNAVMTEAASGYESGTVCEVVQKGYKLNNKVIRPVMVKIAE